MLHILKIMQKGNPKGAERTDAEMETAQCRAENEWLTREVAQLQTLYKQLLRDMRKNRQKGPRKRKRLKLSQRKFTSLT